MENAPAIIVIVAMAAFLFGVWRAARGDRWARYLYGPIGKSNSEDK